MNLLSAYNQTFMTEGARCLTQGQLLQPEKFLEPLWVATPNPFVIAIGTQIDILPVST